MPTSAHDGMGANPYDGGTAFRVWAPFAQALAVAGDFNSWSETANPLSSEGNGYWSADVAGATTGQQYKYVITNGGPLWRNDPYAQAVSSLEQQENTIIPAPQPRWAHDQFQIAPWNELIIYELHVGTFSGGAAAPEKFGDAIARLRYLRELGINAVEIMAAGEFETDTSLGYNPAYIFAIERSYGGIEAFKAFVKAAHEQGIAVILDVVYNHLGPQGLGKCMWRFDGWSENDGGGIYFYQDRRSWTPWGSKNRPNYGRGEVRQYFRDNALTWLHTRGVDGLRWDATAYIRNIYGSGDAANDIPEGWGLMQWINNEANASFPGKINIAEDLQNNEWITKSTGAGGAGFDSQWDAVFTHAIRDAIIGQQDEGRDMLAVRNAIVHRFNNSAFERVIYTESHDEVSTSGLGSRVPEQIWPGNADSWHSKKRSTLGAGIVFTAPGIPMIFQGQEFLEDGRWNDTDLLDWNKATTHAGIVNLYRDLMLLRRNWYNNTRGLRGQHVNVYHVNDDDKIVAFHRWQDGGPGDDVVVVANLGGKAFSNYNIGFPRAGQWKVRFNSDWNGYDPEFGNFFSYDTKAQQGEKDGMPYNGNVGIGPYTLIILSQ